MRIKFYMITCFILSALLLCQVGYAQQKTVQGKVTGEQNNAIPGVTVQVKGTNANTTTDADGNFSINIDKPNAVLVFSFVGYASQQIKPGERTDLNVQLLEDKNQLNEVVVTALGIKKEVKRLGYATTLVKGSDLTKARDVNATAIINR